MISDKLRCVGVHINRTGGASRERVLGRHCRPFGKERRHAKAFELFEILGPTLWESYFSFGFVRNPWDRMVSIYHHRRRVEKPARSRRAQLPFEEWLRCEDTSDGTFGEQAQWLMMDGKIVVDFVRFESLDRDWGIVRERIGVGASLPHVNSSLRRPDYRWYYDRDSREFVGRLCARDLKLFGYTF